MSVFEKEIAEIDPVTLLLQKADEQGYLTNEEILEAFPEAEENIDQLEEVFIFLHNKPRHINLFALCLINLRRSQ